MSESTTVKLADEYDACLLGAAMNPNRYAYSLSRILRFEMKRLSLSVAEVRDVVIAQMQQVIDTHGAEAPLFIDDEILYGEVEDEQVIIRPGDTGFRHLPK